MFNQICNMILSPPRFKYSLYDLGSMISKYGKRIDFIIYNHKNQKMNCSYYQPFQVKYQKTCVVYLHSMNGSRIQSSIYVDKILKLGVSFCSFDFSGCGNSQGNKITFGANEKYQVQQLIKTLKSKFHINRFIMWGRSMGAVCAIKYTQMIYDKANNFEQTQKDDIIGLILDSSFKNFSKLLIQIGSNHTEIPKFIVQAGFYLIKRSLQDNGQFNIEQLDLIDDEKQVKSPIQKIKGNNLPVLFLASKDDKTVPYNNSVDLYNAFISTRKQLKFFKGLHNESRDEDYMNEVIRFINKILQVDKEPQLNSIKSLKGFKRYSDSSIMSSLKLSRSSSNLSQSTIFYQKQNFINTKNRQEKSSLMRMLQRKQQMMQKQNHDQYYEFQNQQTICVCSMFNSSNHQVTKLNSEHTIKNINNSTSQQIQNKQKVLLNNFTYLTKSTTQVLEENSSSMNLNKLSWSHSIYNMKMNNQNSYNGYRKYFQTQPPSTQNIFNPIKCQSTI